MSEDEAYGLFVIIVGFGLAALGVGGCRLMEWWSERRRRF